MEPMCSSANQGTSRFAAQENLQLKQCSITSSGRSCSLCFFTGNAVHRWANAPRRTGRDVKKLMEQLPSGTPCVFMTTVPSYSKKSNDLRKRSQLGIRKAFESYGSECEFVLGHTPLTVKTFQGNKTYFKTSKAGKVRDPYHSTSHGANKFLELRKDALCRAVFKQVKRARSTATATQN